MQEVLKDPGFSKSPQLWRAFIEWQKHKVLGRLRGLISVLDIQKAYGGALKVSANQV